MEILIILILIGVIAAAFYFFILRNKRPENFPPGPKGVPIMGNILQLGLEGYKTVLDWTESGGYGDIIGIRMASRWTVMLNNVEDIRDAFSRNELQARHMFNGFLDELCDDSTLGVMMSSGRIWTEQRRFCLRTLKDFGFGRKSMESIIMEEANDLIEEFKKLKNQPIKTTRAFNAAVFNVIWSIVAGERYPHDDPQLEELTALFTEMMASSQKGIRPLFFVFPVLTHIRDTLAFIFPRRNAFLEKVFSFFRKTIRDHRSTLVEGSPRDLIDTYLEEMAKTTDPTSSFYPKGLDDMELINVLLDIFIAGAETTSITLTWSFFLLALNKEAQGKLFEELQTVVGNRQVSLTDKPSLPYVEATLNEIMRVSSLAAFGIPHSASQDLTLKNYSIPKGTVVFANLYGVHYRKSEWGDPLNFRPERFLSQDGKTVLKNKNFIPFGVGKRVCLGESLARDEFFLFLTNLVQTFEISMPADEPEHTLKITMDVFSRPEPHRILLKERN